MNPQNPPMDLGSGGSGGDDPHHGHVTPAHQEHDDGDQDVDLKNLEDDDNEEDEEEYDEAMDDDYQALLREFGSSSPISISSGPNSRRHSAAGGREDDEELMAMDSSGAAPSTAATTAAAAAASETSDEKTIVGVGPRMEEFLDEILDLHEEVLNRKARAEAEATERGLFPIEDLPDLVQRQIWSYLPTIDILNAQLISPRFYQNSSALIACCRMLSIIANDKYHAVLWSREGADDEMYLTGGCSQIPIFTNRHAVHPADRPNWAATSQFNDDHSHLTIPLDRLRKSRLLNPGYRPLSVGALVSSLASRMPNLQVIKICGLQLTWDDLSQIAAVVKERRPPPPLTAAQFDHMEGPTIIPTVPIECLSIFRGSLALPQIKGYLTSLGPPQTNAEADPCPQIAANMEKFLALLADLSPLTHVDLLTGGVHLPHANLLLARLPNLIHFATYCSSDVPWSKLRCPARMNLENEPRLRPWVFAAGRGRGFRAGRSLVRSGPAEFSVDFAAAARTAAAAASAAAAARAAEAAEAEAAAARAAANPQLRFPHLCVSGSSEAPSESGGGGSGSGSDRRPGRGAIGTARCGSRGRGRGFYAGLTRAATDHFMERDVFNDLVRRLRSERQQRRHPNPDAEDENSDDDDHNDGEDQESSISRLEAEIQAMEDRRNLDEAEIRLQAITRSLPWPEAQHFVVPEQPLGIASPRLESLALHTYFMADPFGDRLAQRILQERRHLTRLKRLGLTLVDHAQVPLILSELRALRALNIAGGGHLSLSYPAGGPLKLYNTSGLAGQPSAGITELTIHYRDRQLVQSLWGASIRRLYVTLTNRSDQESPPPPPGPQGPFALVPGPVQGPEAAGPLPAAAAAVPAEDKRLRDLVRRFPALEHLTIIGSGRHRPPSMETISTAGVALTGLRTITFVGCTLEVKSLDTLFATNPRLRVVRHQFSRFVGCCVDEVIGGMYSTMAKCPRRGPIQILIVDPFTSPSSAPYRKAAAILGHNQSSPHLNAFDKRILCLKETEAVSIFYTDKLHSSLTTT